MAKRQNGKEARGQKATDDFVLPQLAVSPSFRLSVSPSFRLAILSSDPFGALAPALERSEGMAELKN